MAQFGDFKCDNCDRDMSEDAADPFVVSFSVGVTPSHNRDFPDIDTVKSTAYCREIHKTVKMRVELCLTCFGKLTGGKMLPAKKAEA